MPAIPQRDAWVSVDENIGTLVTSKREAHASADILLGYGSVYNDRTGYVSVDDNVAVGAPSTREGYASSDILLGYGSVYNDRTGYVGMDLNIGIPGPVYTDLYQPQRGWGTPLRDENLERIVLPATAGVFDIAANTVISVVRPVAARDGSIGVDQDVVAARALPASTNYAINPVLANNADTYSVIAPFEGERIAIESGEYAWRGTYNSGAFQADSATIQVPQQPVSAIPAQTCGVYLLLRCIPGKAKTLTIRMRALSGSQRQEVFGTQQITVSEHWQRYDAVGVLPAGRDGFVIEVGPDSGTDWVAGDWVEHRMVTLWKGTDPLDPFTGDSPDTVFNAYDWSGTPHASTSIRSVI